MSVNLSYLAGAGAQFFTNNGIPLAGGLLYSYLAGTSTPAATYTSATGLIANSNPIVLDSAGRTPSQVWLADGAFYKFVLNDSVSSLIGTYDNMPAIGGSLGNSNLIAVSGTNTLTSSSNFVSYTAGMQLSFLPVNTNTGAVTINLNGLGAKAIKQNGSNDLSAGALQTGRIALVEYDGTQFQLLNSPQSSFVYSILFGL